jgi:transposase
MTTKDHTIVNKQNKTKQKLVSVGYRFIPLPPYSPDLGPSDSCSRK